eukprot:jgi/Bigna1/136679/aug1.35_g11387
MMMMREHSLEKRRNKKKKNKKEKKKKKKKKKKGCSLLICSPILNERSAFPSLYSFLSDGKVDIHAVNQKKPKKTNIALVSLETAISARGLYGLDSSWTPPTPVTLISAKL